MKKLVNLHSTPITILSRWRLELLVVSTDRWQEEINGVKSHKPSCHSSLNTGDKLSDWWGCQDDKTVLNEPQNHPKSPCLNNILRYLIYFCTDCAFDRWHHYRILIHIYQTTCIILIYIYIIFTIYIAIYYRATFFCSLKLRPVYTKPTEWCIRGPADIRLGSKNTSVIRLRHVSWCLTPCGLVTPYRSIDLGQHWLR